MRHLCLYIITLIFLSCTTPEGHSNTFEFEYDYQIKTYYGDTLDKSLRRVDYFDKTGKLIRAVGRDEGCTRFIYDSQGHLLEKIWGRTCDSWIRELMMYDSSYNLLGTFKTRDTLVNLDTVKYKQRLFYDADNNLTKELEREWNSSDGEHFEQWCTYAYENGRKVSDTIKQNGNIVWIGTYTYDANNNLISINRLRNSIFKLETFKYDSAARVIESEIKSNEYSLTSNVTFSAGNNKTFYSYGSNGQLTEKKILSHKGKVQSKAIFVRVNKMHE
jgi:hypothetical protein